MQRANGLEFVMSQRITHTFLKISVFCLIELLALAAGSQNSRPVQEGRAARDAASQAPTARADIPFEFWIGPERMPPGKYTLQIVVPTVDIIRSDDGKLERQFTMLDVGGPVPKMESKLVFIESNDKYMLFEVWSIYSKRRLSAQNSETKTEGGKTLEVPLIYPHLDSGGY